MLLYRGKSLLSWRIKLATLSKESHAAWLKTTEQDRAMIRLLDFNDKGVAGWIKSLGCLEAWHKGGVRESANLADDHKKGTPIDVYDVPSIEEWKYELIEKAIRNEVGDGYWFGGILAARLNRWDAISPPVDQHGDISKWFCSHLLEHKLREYGCGLVSTRRPDHSVWPGMFAASTRTVYLGTLTT